MKIGNYNIKPVLLYLPDDEFWFNEWKEAQAYLASEGIDDVYEIPGIHYKWGVRGGHIYLADNKPEEQFYIGDKKVAGNLSQYLCFSVMNALNETHFLFMEGDVRFLEGWQEKLEQALNDVPEDFDFLYIGSCCCQDKEPVPLKGNIFHFPWRGEEKKFFYPQCSHAMIIAKKCLPYLIDTNRDVANPADVSLIINSFPRLNIYAVLPRIADQGTKTELPE